MNRRLIIAAVVATVTLAAHAHGARADAAGGVLLNRTWLQSRGDSGSEGFGAEYAVVSTRKPYLMTIGGFYAMGQPDGDKQMRDVYAVRWGFGFKPKIRKAPKLLPFVSVGLDFLHVTTRMPDTAMHAGMTLGFDARGGVFGVYDKKWLYQVSVAYMGAIVPGTGDGLDGAVLQVGIGKVLFD